MEIKPLETPTEVYGALMVNNLAWREAYQDLLPDEVIDRVPAEPPEEHVEELYDSVGGDEEVFLVAVDEAKYVRGYIYVRWGDETKEFVGETEAGLKEIYVHPEWWGQGIGTALLDEALDMLPSSIEAIRLEMLAGNEDAHEFYLARGFELAGHSEFSIGGEPYPTDIYVRSL